MRFIYRIFLKGFLALLPIALTVALFAWIKSQAESAFAEPLRQAFPELLGFPGAGVLVALLVIFLTGLIVNTYLARPFVHWLDRRLETLPIVSSVYSPIRDITRLFMSEGRGSAQKVVMVRINDAGFECLGLVTRESFEDLPAGTVPRDSVAVFMPFSYGMGGMTVLIPRAQIRETGLSAERAMQLSITGWIRANK